MNQKTDSESKTARWEIAAGGVLIERGRDGPTIAVVHRRRHADVSGERGDWTLPKGHLEPGESWLDAALREVREETGCTARINGEPTTMCYMADGVPKLVVFYPMEVSGHGESVDHAEVQKVVWLSPREAHGRLTYPKEQKVLRAFYPQATPPAKSSKSNDDSILKLRVERLLSHIVELRITASDLESRSGAHSTIRKDIDVQLDKAHFNAEAGHLNLGWSYYKGALRRHYRMLEDDPQALRDRAEMLRCQAREKLDRWRQEAALTVLRRVKAPGNEEDGPETAESEPLILAQSILDEHFDNVYFKMEVAAESLQKWPRLLLIFVLALILLATLYANPSVGPYLLNGNKPPVLGDGPGYVLLLALLGALGAAVSRALTTLRLAGRIPQLLRRGTDWMLRVTVGAASGLGIAFLVHAEFLAPIPAESIPALAFVAGFSDQLLTRAINRTVAAAND